MAEEILRARRPAIGAGHEDGDQIADPGARRHDVIGKPVEWRAKTADDADFLLGRLAEAACDRRRIVAAHDLTEIARCRELVVHSAVDDQEGLAVALLA